MKIKGSRPKVAIAHDYLRTFGGGERVVLALHEIWPDAPIFVATADYKRLGVFGDQFKKLNIRTSWAQKFFPFVKKPLLYRFLLTRIWGSFDLKRFDVVISSSGANIAKGVKLPEGALHICYCHTPPRFLYGFETETTFLDSPILKTLASPFVSFLRSFDQESSRRVDFFIANSRNVAERIKKIYNRNSKVIYPPCELPTKSEMKIKNGSYYLAAGRLVRYKNVELTIRAANKLKLPLKIVGNGTQKSYLENLAGPTVEFLGEVDDKKLANAYRGCRALIVATNNEDFGMTPVEAMSFGKPVIAYSSGGLRETIVDGETGVLFRKLSVSDLTKAIRKFEAMNFDPEKIRRHSQKFSKERFRQEIKNFVTKAYQEYRRK